MKKVTVQLIAAAIVLIVVLIVYTLWYMAVSAESAQVASLQQQILQKSQTATRISSAKSELAQLDPEKQEVSQYFISTNNIVVFLEQLSSVGQNLGATVQVASVSATQPSGGTPYGSIDLSLKITGSFQAVMRTLGAIEYGPYNIKTNSVTFDAGGQTGGKTEWTATAMFTISTQNATQNTPLLTAPKQTAPTTAPTQTQATTAAKTSTATSSGTTGVAKPTT